MRPNSARASLSLCTRVPSAHFSLLIQSIAPLTNLGSFCLHAIPLQRYVARKQSADTHTQSKGPFCFFSFRRVPAWRPNCSLLVVVVLAGHECLCVACPRAPQSALMHHNLDNVSTLAPDHEPTYGLTVHLKDSKLHQGQMAQTMAVHGNCALSRHKTAHPTRKLNQPRAIY